MSFVIRKAVMEDVPEIAEVITQTWRSAYRGIVNESYLTSRSASSREASWRERIQKETLLNLVAEDDGRIIGVASGGPARDPDIARCHWERYTSFMYWSKTGAKE